MIGLSLSLDRLPNQEAETEPIEKDPKSQDLGADHKNYT